MSALVPRVSVCIPVFNGIRWVESTLDSVFAQTMGNFEVILRDDCSTDGTLDLVRSKFGADARFRAIQNSTRLDVGGQYNALFSDARGEFILKLDADDLVAPTFLGRVLDCADTHSADVVMAGWEWFHPDTLATSRPAVHANLLDGFVGDTFRTVVEDNPFSLCFGIWRRSLLPAIARDGQFVLYTETCDWECQLRLAHAGTRFYYVSDVLGRYRLHGANRSRKPNVQSESVICDVLPYWHDEIGTRLGRHWIRRRAWMVLRNHLANVARRVGRPSAKLIGGALRLVLGCPRFPDWCIRPDLARSDGSRTSPQAASARAAGP